jgi:hypothetical protein
MTHRFDASVRPGRELWRSSRPLVAVAAVMTVMLVISMAGLLLDPRVITGAPAWMKPAKFAASTAIYALTLAWVFRSLPGWPRLRQIVGWTTAVVFAVEVAIIDMQAWRGTTSHFNVATTFDAVMFGIMGTLITLQTITSGAVAVALWRERGFADRALGWALRLGMTLTIVGATVGGMMTRPTAAQLERAGATQVMTIVGAHTVGAPDGGAGLPGVGWSREHGDLRVPHFVGLHALQVLPLLVLALRRRGSPEPLRVRAAIVAAAAYAGLFVTLLVQALRGQPVLQPDLLTLGMLAVVGAAGAAAWWIAGGARVEAVPAVL